ncbi:MAG: hypothetical protein HPY71_14545 [Firmicutes bacterium]|nr:hypothetical protein [Bacillota bacterium]
MKALMSCVLSAFLAALLLAVMLCPTVAFGVTGHENGVLEGPRQGVLCQGNPGQGNPSQGSSGHGAAAFSASLPTVARAAGASSLLPTVARAAGASTLLPTVARAAGASSLLPAVSQAGEDFGASDGGSFLVGAHEASTTWYFAAGAAGDGWETVFSVDNPGNVQANVYVVFYTEVGEIASPSFAVGPRSSSSFDLSQHLSGAEAGAKITSSQPVVARRTIYGEGFIETNLGAASLSTKLFFAEGWVGPGFLKDICVINPGDTDTVCTLEYLTASGLITTTHPVKKRSHVTVSVSEDLGEPQSADVFVVLSSPQPVQNMGSYLHFFLALLQADLGTYGGVASWVESKLCGTRQHMKRPLPSGS